MGDYQNESLERNCINYLYLDFKLAVNMTYRFNSVILIFPGLVILSIMAIWIFSHYIFLYVSLVWLVIIVIKVMFSKNEKIKLFAIYMGSVILAFFLAELYFINLSIKDSTETKPTKEVTYIAGWENRKLVGGSPLSNSKILHRLVYGDSIVFDVTQTIGNNTIRHTPGQTNSDAIPILFLGCSFTYGAGLNDDETLPYFLQTTSNGQFKTINMGSNSYGAHQTLAILQARYEEKELLGQKPKAAFFTAITDHIFRGTGVFANTFGPKYILNDKKEIVYKGITPSYIERSENFLRFHLGKSYTLNRVFFGRRKAKDRQIELVVAMIHKASVIFESRYDAPFYCLLWDEFDAEPGLYEKILKRLEQKKVKTLEINKIIPNYTNDPSPYLLYQNGHPNGRVNQLIGEYLYKFLEGQDDTATD